MKAVLFVFAIIAACSCQAKHETIEGEPPSLPVRAPAVAVVDQAPPDGSTELSAVDGLEAIFQAEQADAAWASVRETEVQTAIDRTDAPKLLSVACKTTICKIEVEGTENPPVRLAKLALRRTPFVAVVKGTTTTIYAAKPGYSLPTAPNVAAKNRVTYVVNGTATDQPPR